MSGERVDLDDLMAKAKAALNSAMERGDATEPFGPVGYAWTLSPRRDGSVDVVIASSGADVFDRALEVDARFAVAAQPAVVVALVERILQLEQALEKSRSLALDADELYDDRMAFARTVEALLEEGVVLA